MKLLQYFVSIVLVLHTFSAVSQVTLSTQQDIGGNSSDFFSQLILTKDGGRLLAGSSLSGISGDKTDTSKGGWDFWIVKLDNNEKIQWSKTIGGNIDDILEAAIQTNDGGYLVGGYSSSDVSGDKTGARRGGIGGEDYWLVKLDSTGKIQWDKTFGGTMQDNLTALLQTTDGGYLLGGFSLSGISADKTDTTRGYSDFWIIKINKNGKEQWQKTIGGNAYDKLSSLMQTPDGKYILAGTSASDKSGEKSANSMHSKNDYWLVQIDNSGSIVWDKTIGGGDLDELYNAQRTRDGGFILAGSSTSSPSGDKTEGKKGLFGDFWIVKADSIGNKQWDRTLGGNGFSIPYSIQQTIDNGYIVGGRASSGIANDVTEQNRGDNDFWIVKLAFNGKLQWDKTIGGSGRDELRTIREVKKNSYVVAGLTASDISGDKTVALKTPYDYWTINFSYKKPATKKSITSYSNLSTQSGTKNNTGISFYPNPAINTLYIKLAGIQVVSITDLSGKTVAIKKITNAGSINVQGLAPSVYFVKTNSGSFSQKLIITK